MLRAGGDKLCYEAATTLQVLVPGSAQCSGDGGSVQPGPAAAAATAAATAPAAGYFEHYSHPPLQGSYSK